LILNRSSIATVSSLLLVPCFLLLGQATSAVDCHPLWTPGLSLDLDSKMISDDLHLVSPLPGASVSLPEPSR